MIQEPTILNKTINLVDHLPEHHLLRRYSAYVAFLTDMPVNSVFLMGLAVYGSMATRKYSVLYENGERLPIGLYVVVEQPSGTGKTRILNKFQFPFNEIHKAVLAQFEKEAQSAQKIKSTGMEDSLLKIARLKASSFITNSTPEALEERLTKTGGYFSAISSEQGLLTSLLGLSYKANAKTVNNNDIVLSGFDGGYANSARITRKSCYSGYVIGSMACFAQQGSIDKIFDESNGTGLYERFLTLKEEHSLGRRDHLREKPVNSELEAEYAKACGFIRAVFENPNAPDNLTGLKLCSEGYKAIAEFRNKIESDLGDGKRYSHIALRGAAGKINMQIMKIVAILWLCDAGFEESQPIPLNLVESAIGIAYDLLEANYALCQEKGFFGRNAAFEAVLRKFKKPTDLLNERQLIQNLSGVKHFKDYTGNKSDYLRSVFQDMVNEGLLVQTVNGKSYRLG